jgi:type IV secretion system protein VirD4
MTEIRLGYRNDFSKVLRYPGEAHLITVAPTRSGKGRDVLIPALLEYDGSCIVIDPKGQLAAVTGPERARMGQRIVILNPFNILPEVLGPDSPEHFRGVENECVFGAAFNPMAALDPAADSFGPDCDNIADSIIVRDAKGQDSHWSDSARGLVAGLIGYLAIAMPEKLRNLARVREVISSAKELSDIATDATQPGSDEFIGQALSRFAEKEAANKGELASIISTAKTQTQFIGNKAISRSLSGPGFRFRDLKFRKTTVYLVLPTRYLATCGKWFRLVLASALDDLLREERGDYPVLAIMDEFAQLGRLAVIENALALTAGYGLQLWPVLQDLTQLQEHYPTRWETFLANAGVQQYFAPREKTTSDYVSYLTGVAEVGSLSTSQSMNQDGTESLNQSFGENEMPRFHPHEVRQIDRNQSILFMDVVKDHVMARRKPYYEIPEFRTPRVLYSPDPYHRAKKSLILP